MIVTLTDMEFRMMEKIATSGRFILSALKRGPIIAECVDSRVPMAANQKVGLLIAADL